MSVVEEKQFEKLFRETFPDVYEIYLLGKDVQLGGGGERHIWMLMQTLIEMNKLCKSGAIHITYTKGRIDHINKTEKVLGVSRKELE